MKEIVEEMNQIHKRISEVRVQINELERDIGAGNSVGREIRDEIIKGKIEDLVEEHTLLITRLKKVVK